MLINDLYTNKTPAVTEANDPNFVGFMNNTLGDRVDAKPEQPKTGHDWYDNAPTMSMDNMPSYKHAFKFGMSVLQSMDAETKQHFAEADNDELFSYLMKLARKKRFEPKYFVEEDMFEVTGLFSEIFHDPSMVEWEWSDLLRSTLNNQDMTESMGRQVVFRGTGADGGTYEIIQSEDGFMIHANGRHIDTYGSLQRAMSVLKNEVPGLQQGVAEGKVKLYTDPSYFGAEVDDTGFDNLPIVNISANQLVGFEPDDKMNQPKSKANVEKIVAGLKQGAKLPPLLVRKYKNGYQVLDGHHRFWAYKLLGVKSIPSRIVPDEDIEEISKQGVAEGLNEQYTSTYVSPDLQDSREQAEIQALEVLGKSIRGDDWDGDPQSIPLHNYVGHHSPATSDGKGNFNSTYTYTLKVPPEVKEGSELKQAKRKYNQAAKDANADQVGAGKKIDTMKNSLRQKDLNKPVAEAQTDYQKRRQRERDVDAGKPVKPEPKNPQNDYFARRKKERDLAEGWRDIYNLNKQKIGNNPNLIKTGTILTMPDGSPYKVKSGDNLSSIAKTLSVKPTQLSKPPVAGDPFSAAAGWQSGTNLQPKSLAAATAEWEKEWEKSARTPPADDTSDIANVFQNVEPPPDLTRDERQQQMLTTPNLGGPNAPGPREVTGPNGEKFQFDTDTEAIDFRNNMQELRRQDRERQGLGAKQSESTSAKKKGMAEDDDAVAAFMARGGEIQRLKSAKPRKGERWQGSSHIGAAGGRGTKGRVSGLGANTGKSGKPVVTAEDSAPTSRSIVNPRSKSGIVSKADLEDYRLKSGNPTATLGQYMNQQQGKTFRKGGANDPDVIAATQNKAVATTAEPKPGSWQELAKLNNITDPTKLQTGTYIKTPDGGSIKVNKGDTLSDIAQYMRVSGTSPQYREPGSDNKTSVSNPAPAPAAKTTDTQSSQQNKGQNVGTPSELKKPPPLTDKDVASKKSPMSGLRPDLKPDLEKSEKAQPASTSSNSNARIQADIAALEREISRQKPSLDPKEQTRLGILNKELTDRQAAAAAAEAPAAVSAKAPVVPTYKYDPDRDAFLNKNQPYYGSRNSGMPSAHYRLKPSMAQNESISQRLTKEFDHMLEHLLSEATNQHKIPDFSVPIIPDNMPFGRKFGGGGGGGGSAGNAMRLSAAGRLTPAPATKSQAMATQRNVGGKEIPRFLPKDEKAMNSKVNTTSASSNPDLPKNVQIAPSMRPAPTDKNFSDFLKGQGSQTFGPATNTINPTNKPTKVDIQDAGDFYPESKNITNRGITNTFEDDAAYDPFANDPAADAKHEADVFAKLQQQNAQGKGTKIKDMNPLDRDQYLKSTGRQWDEKTQRIVPATKPKIQEVSLGDYRKKATVNKAVAQTDRFFGRDDPAVVARADKTIANRTKGLAGADARRRPYTAPPQDAEKQQRDLTTKYPNIDQLVADAERNRDPYYDRAEGNAYYAGREAEQNYQKLKQIQRVIQGLNESLKRTQP